MAKRLPIAIPAKSTTPISINELYWAAGFLEGEGCFTLQRKQPTVCAAQVDRQPLERLQRVFGYGNIRFLPRYQPNHRHAWQWTILSRRATAVMMTLYPLLSPRRQERIKDVLAVWKSTPARPGKALTWASSA